VLAAMLDVRDCVPFDTAVHERHARISDVNQSMALACKEDLQHLCRED
jgi:hypothetical protein